MLSNFRNSKKNKKKPWKITKNIKKSQKTYKKTLKNIKKLQKNTENSPKKYPKKPKKIPQKTHKNTQKNPKKTKKNPKKISKKNLKIYNFFLFFLTPFHSRVGMDGLNLSTNSAQTRVFLWVVCLNVRFRSAHLRSWNFKEHVSPLHRFGFTSVGVC